MLTTDMQPLMHIPFIYFVVVALTFAVGLATAKPLVDTAYGRGIERWAKGIFSLARTSPNRMYFVIFLNNTLVLCTLLMMTALYSGPLWLIPMIGANMYILGAKSAALGDFLDVKPKGHLHPILWVAFTVLFFVLEIGTLLWGAALALHQSMTEPTVANRWMACFIAYAPRAVVALGAAALFETLAIWWPPEELESEDDY